MKTYFYIGAAVAGLLSAAAVNAQVLGGNVAGGLGGTLSGGMRDMNVITQGSGNGSFGGSLDTGSLRRSTTDITGRATSRVHGTTDIARERTRSGLNGARAKTESAANVATGAAVDAAGNATAATRQIDATTSVAGSLASDATVAGGEASGALDAAHRQQAVVSSVSESQLAPQAASDRSAGVEDSASRLTVPGAAMIEGSASGSAQGSTSASKDGASADASAETSGTAGVSLQR